MTEQNPHHSLTLSDRSELTLTGILDVVAFDEKGALLKTSLGLLSLDGDGLHVKALSVDDGEMTLEGRLNALIYLGENDKSGRKKRGLLA